MSAWHSMGQAAYLAGCIAMQWSNTITGFDKTTQRMDKDRYNSKWITSRDATASGNTQNFCYPFPTAKVFILICRNSVSWEFATCQRRHICTHPRRRLWGPSSPPPSASAISIPSASRRRKLSFFREASYSVGPLHAWHIRSAHFHIENVLFSNFFEERFFSMNEYKESIQKAEQDFCLQL